MRLLIWRFMILTLLFIISWPADAARVLVLGDSLSDAYNIPRESGWVHLLEVTVAPEHEVINASISGETTAGAAARIDELMDTHLPDVLLIILGGNDGLRGLNPNQTRDNLEAIITAGRAIGARVLLMQIRIPSNLGPAYTQRFERIYPDLARRHNATLLPFFVEDIFDRPGMMMEDGIHPTAQAQPLMLEAVRPHIDAVLE